MSVVSRGVDNTLDVNNFLSVVVTRCQQSDSGSYSILVCVYRSYVVETTGGRTRGKLQEYCITLRESMVGLSNSNVKSIVSVCTSCFSYVSSISNEINVLELDVVRQVKCQSCFNTSNVTSSSCVGTTSRRCGEGNSRLSKVSTTTVGDSDCRNLTVGDSTSSSSSCTRSTRSADRDTRCGYITRTSIIDNNVSNNTRLIASDQCLSTSLRTLYQITVVKYQTAVWGERSEHGVKVILQDVGDGSTLSTQTVSTRTLRSQVSFSTCLSISK